jgi:DNA-binding NarL/FixJ family response regulator
MVFHVSAGEAIAEHRQHPFDVVVADMLMPEMSGIDLIKRLTEHSPLIPMVLTGSSDLRTAVAAINEANVFRFYTKPCLTSVLAQGIKRALSQAEVNSLRQLQTLLPSPDAAFGVALLHRLPLGVVVVERTARILFMNSRGAEYVASNEGLTMGRGGVCRASWPAETAELHRLIAAVVDGGEKTPVRAISVSRENRERPLSIVVAPLTAVPEASLVAVLLISDPDRQSVPSPDIVSRLFDLTEAESRLALLLAEGQRIEEAAVNLGITLSSARTYLKHVFSKVGVTRQAELVRLVLAAPTLLDLGAISKAPKAAALVPEDAR